MSRRTIVLAALLFAIPRAALAQNAPVIVTVNGAPVGFDQPPVERVGRVYVPLRGVFERLGATVVYDGGKIAATRGATSVSLQVGSTAAVVNGGATALDDAPFVIGSRVLVPLRFVAQALGAAVNYDGSQHLVAIVSAQPTAPPVVLTPRPAALRLLRVEPVDRATVNGLRPQIGATFPRAVDPNAVRITFDGRDVTPDSYVSAHAVSYDPQYDVPYGAHRVTVTAPGISDAWSFASAAAAAENFLRDVSPPNGVRVGSTFTVQGYTRPGSRVHIVVTANADVGPGEVAATTVTADAGADPNGHFARQMTIADGNAAVVDVRLESHAPDGAVTVRTLRLRP